MKVITKQIDSHDNSGFVKIIPEVAEDIWQLYQLIIPGDQVEASTYRRITKETSSSVTKHDSERIRMNLVISVEHVNVDLTVNVLHLHGRVCRENKHVKVLSINLQQFINLYLDGQFSHYRY